MRAHRQAAGTCSDAGRKSFHGDSIMMAVPRRFHGDSMAKVVASPLPPVVAAPLGPHGGSSVPDASSAATAPLVVVTAAMGGFPVCDGINVGIGGLGGTPQRFGFLGGKGDPNL